MNETLTLERVEAVADADTGRLIRVDTPLGAMYALASDTALCALEFTEDEDGDARARASRWSKSFGAVERRANAILDQTVSELAEYFSGSRREFAVPLAPRGTPFQQSAWAMLTAIPYGTTRSYGEQARFIGRPTATRAVARANGDNPIAIIIPCHRIIGSNGTLTGYGGGLWRKQWLLDHESGGALDPAVFAVRSEIR